MIAVKRELDLTDETWAAFDAAAEVRGSHEAVLRWWLSAGGVFEPNAKYGDGSGTLGANIAMCLGQNPTQADIDEATKILTGSGNTIDRTDRYLKHLKSQKHTRKGRG